MTLVRWNPYQSLSNFEREISNWFSGFPGLRYRDGEVRNWDWIPAAEIVEKKNSYEIDLELPGVEKESVKINLTDDILTIQGEKKAEKNTEGDNYCACERVYGSFVRSFTLPGTIDREKVEAKFKNGILHLSIPKSENAKTKEIKIQ